MTVLIVALATVAAFAGGRSHRGDRAIMKMAARGSVPAGTVGTSEIADDAVDGDKIADNAVSSAMITDGVVAPADASAALKTKTAVAAVGGFNATEQKYLFVAPYACTVSAVGLVSDTTTSSSNAGTNFAFQVQNLTQANSLCSSATNTSQTEITGDARYVLPVDQNLTLTADDVLELQITKTGAPTDLSSAEVIAVVDYY
jgi:hypothetical protein